MYIHMIIYNQKQGTAHRAERSYKMAKRTYDGTWTISKERLPKATFKIEMYKNTKYDQYEPDVKIEYKGVTSWDIIEGGEEAEAIEAETDGNSIDEYHEYLILHLASGETATYRNSHIDLRIYK